MKLYFRLEIFGIRFDYDKKTNYLLVPLKDNIYPSQAVYVSRGVYESYNNPTAVWGKFYKYKKIWPKPTISTTEKS